MAAEYSGRPVRWALVLAMPALVVPPARACRCAPQPLADYFAAADVVAEVEVTALRADDPAGPLYATLRTLRDFKNAAGLRAVRTARDGAQCGVALEPGRRYWVFGQLAPGSAVPVIGRCDGSRAATRNFVDTPATQAGAALDQRSATLVCASPAPLEIAARLRLESVARDAAELAEGVLSPNGGYRFLLQLPNPIQRLPREARLIVDHERDPLLALSLHGVTTGVRAEWINEKLILLQAPWSATLRSDLLLDVEAGELLAVETARLDDSGQVRDWLESRCHPRACAHGHQAAAVDPTIDLDDGSTSSRSGNACDGLF